MENNQEISVKKELTPLKSGDVIKHEIKNGLKIRELQNPEPLKQALRRIFVLVGIRPEQIPNEEEKTILISFIRKRFGNYTANEIVLAFENALCDVFKADTEHFGQFTIKYFTGILNAYTTYRNGLAKELQIEEEKERKAEIEKEQAAKIEEFRNRSIDIYRKSIVCGEWNGDVFHANAIAREVAKQINQLIKNDLWEKAKKKKYLQDKAFKEDPKIELFQGKGVTAERIFSELIVIEGIKQKIRI